MKWHLAVVVFLLILAAITAAQAGTNPALVFCGEQEEPSWIFQQSYFSHDPDNGNRVAQYAPEPTSYTRDDPTYMESGYRHNQIFTFGPNGTADRMHIVQTWGQGEFIRPYGEWEFPYRAGATPYGPWGNPQGPWTMPFDSWQNPYGLLNHLPNSGWPFPSGPGPVMPYGSAPGYGAGAGLAPGTGYGSGYGSGYGPGYGGGSTPYSAPPPPGPGMP